MVVDPAVGWCAAVASGGGQGYHGARNVVQWAMVMTGRAHAACAARARATPTQSRLPGCHRAPCCALPPVTCSLPQATALVKGSKPLPCVPHLLFDNAPKRLPPPVAGWE